MKDERKRDEPPRPFCSVGHPATIRLLEQILPGKQVRDFSLHFPLVGVATITAEILLSKDDAEELAAVAVQYELTAREPESVEEEG